LKAQMRMFSKMHTKVAVIGAGPAGHSLSAQLMKSDSMNRGDITVFDPSTEHHYQPSYTMVGGGMFGNANETKKVEESYVVRPQSELFNQKPEVNWVKKSVTSFKPE